MDLKLPGDKSIGHRFLILGALAEGESRLKGVPDSLDVRSTGECLRDLGVDLASDGSETLIRGPASWRSPTHPLDCGNSGTTARLLVGLLSGLGVEARLQGDASLSRRPMDRVVYPLQSMGARIRYLEAPDRLPIQVEKRASGQLRTLRYRPRVSSAQVRGALLLAALASRTDLEILDRLRPRDHTERILASLGAPIDSEADGEGERISLRAAGWDGRLKPLVAEVPGDLSAAAFLIVAALLAQRPVTVRSVGLNPSRTGFLDVLQRMGADVVRTLLAEEAGEPRGDLTVGAAQLRPFGIGESEVPGLVDEVPALAVLASRTAGVSEIRGASELRVKESDRLRLLASNLNAVGVRCEELDDGLRIHGTDSDLAGSITTGGDHRIAMAFGVLAASPGCEIAIDDPACVRVSFPGFWDALDRLSKE